MDEKAILKELGWESVKGKLYSGPLFLSSPGRIEKMALLGVRTIYCPDIATYTRGVDMQAVKRAGLVIKPVEELVEKWGRENPRQVLALKRRFNPSEIVPLALIDEMKTGKVAFCCGLGARSVGVLQRVRYLVKEPVQQQVPSTRLKRLWQRTRKWFRRKG